MIKKSNDNYQARLALERLRTEFARAADHFRGCFFAVFASYFPKSPSEWDSFLAEYRAVQDDNGLPAPDVPPVGHGLPDRTRPACSWERRLPLSGGNWLARCGGPEPSETVFKRLAAEGVRLATALRGESVDPRVADSVPEAAWLNLVWATANASPARFDINRYSFREWVDHFHCPPVTRTIADPSALETTLNVLISDFREGLFAPSAAVIDLWLDPTNAPHEVSHAGPPLAPQFGGEAPGSTGTSPTDSQTPKPVWNEVDGELLWMGMTIRKYESQSAPTQVAILAAFQKAGWPSTILNPFVDEPPDAKVRAAYQKNLRSRIEALNEGLKEGTIVFRAVRGARVAWEPADAAGVSG